MTKKLNAENSEYPEVRGLSRGLAVLRVLNRLPGGVGAPTEIARLSGIHRTTVKRILETLRVAGYVRHADREGRYHLTFEVRRLSEGFENAGWIEHVAIPAMKHAVRELLWPSDLGTVEAGFIVVRESTHRWSSLSQHRAMIGERMPVFVTSLGRAYLAACSEAELDAILKLLGARQDWIGEMARNRKAVLQEISDTRSRGYACNDGEWTKEANFAANSVPIFTGSELLGCINIVYPKAAISTGQLETRFIPALKRLAEGIGRSSQHWGAS